MGTGVKARALVILIEAIGTCLGASVAGGVRAQNFGLSAGGLLAESFYAAIVIVLMVKPAHILLSWRDTQAYIRPGGGLAKWLAIVGLWFLSVLLCEIWFAVEERAFVRECQAVADTRRLARPRWAPYRSYGLVYSDGTFSAHD